MPELPDVVVYVEALEARLKGKVLRRLSIRGPFLLRSVAPAPETAVGRSVKEVRRIGKRIAIGFEGGPWLVFHLMIAGRLHWRPKAPSPTSRGYLAILEFDGGALTLTEAGTQHRASLHVVANERDLPAFSAGGIEILESTLQQFRDTLRLENHTLKRSLTDPRLFSGVGNAYSDEILHRARLSPVALSQNLTDQQIEGLFHASREVITEWVERLRREAGGEFPEKVTAFRDDMAVHGRYGLPCPRCGGKVQRIRYASNETNYCPACQTGGKLLADRALSRLLGQDWPRSLDELEALKSSRSGEKTT